MTQDTEVRSVLLELKLQISEANKILDILRPLTSNGEIYKTVLDELISKIETAHKDISTAKSANTKYLNELKVTKDELTNFIDESRSLISEIKTVTSEIKNSQAKAQKWLETIDGLKEQSNTSKKEITAKKNEANDLFKALEKLSKKSDWILTKIEADKTISEDLLDKLQEIAKQAEVNSKELARFYKTGKDSFEKIETQSKRIDNFEKISSDKTGKVQEYFDRLIAWFQWRKPIKEEISDILIKIKANQEQIDKQLQDSAANRLCVVFKEKEERLKEEVLSWKDKVFLITYLLIGVNVILLVTWPILKHWNIAIGIDIWRHLWIIAPLAIILWFSILEHGRLKRILDEYSHKYIAAFSMPAYHELIEARDESKAAEFLIKTIEEIYYNPSHKINSNSKQTLIDYIPEFFKDFRDMFWKKEISIPDLKATIWDYGIEIKKSAGIAGE